MRLCTGPQQFIRLARHHHARIPYLSRAPFSILAVMTFVISVDVVAWIGAAIVLVSEPHF